MTLKLLSLHPFYECNLKCPFCYNNGKALNTDSKPLEWFLGFPRVCSTMGIKQIAVGGGEPYVHPEFLEEMARECNKNGVKLNVTTNGQHKNFRPIKGINLVSVSIDHYKQPNIQTLKKTMDAALKIKKESLLGINLILDDKVFENLFDIVRVFLRDADFIYLLQMKPDSIAISNEHLKSRIQALSSFYSGRLYVDDSLKLMLGFQERCGHGIDMASIGADGSVSMCSFDKPFMKLEKPEDLINLVDVVYPSIKGREVRSCPFINKEKTVNAVNDRLVYGGGMPC